MLMMQSDGTHLDSASYDVAHAVMASRGVRVASLCCIRVYDTLSYICWLHASEAVLQGTIQLSISQHQTLANTMHYFQTYDQDQVW